MNEKRYRHVRRPDGSETQECRFCGGRAVTYEQSDGTRVRGEQYHLKGCPRP